MNKTPDLSPEMIVKSGLMQVPAYPLHLAKVLIQVGLYDISTFCFKFIIIFLLN
jgi:hypothetical protein